ncbi:MAG TPA: hypothetical protein VF069_29725 [Streptosporangiaceae bacterium]
MTDLDDEIDEIESFDADALRALAEAEESVREGDVVYGVEAVRALLDARLKRTDG